MKCRLVGYLQIMTCFPLTSIYFSCSEVENVLISSYCIVYAYPVTSCSVVLSK